jgi:hypothetical protein
MAVPGRPQEAAEKIKRETDVHLRQLAKKSTYVPFFFFKVRFWAFLGKGSAFQNKITGEIYFRGGDFFLGDLFFVAVFCCVG